MTGPVHNNKDIDWTALRNWWIYLAICVIPALVITGSIVVARVVGDKVLDLNVDRSLVGIAEPLAAMLLSVCVLVLFDKWRPICTRYIDGRNISQRSLTWTDRVLVYPWMFSLPSLAMLLTFGAARILSSENGSENSLLMSATFLPFISFGMLIFPGIVQYFLETKFIANKQAAADDRWARITVVVFAWIVAVCPVAAITVMKISFGTLKSI